jgi:type II secretory ATPase GspE/PulE/Tfp pilus assembly ATPase PilB-like protein
MPLKSITVEDVEIIKEVEEKDNEDLKSLSELPPVVRLINSIIADAIKLDASDIHIEPRKTAVTFISNHERLRSLFVFAWMVSCVK